MSILHSAKPKQTASLEDMLVNLPNVSACHANLKFNLKFSLSSQLWDRER